MSTLMDNLVEMHKSEAHHVIFFKSSHCYRCPGQLDICTPVFENIIKKLPVEFIIADLHESVDVFRMYCALWLPSLMSFKGPVIINRLEGEQSDKTYAKFFKEVRSSVISSQDLQ